MLIHEIRITGDLIRGRRGVVSRKGALLPTVSPSGSKTISLRQRQGRGER